MIVRGSKTHEDFRDSVSQTRCEKLLATLSKKKKINLQDIGSRSNNLLLDFLKCHTKLRRHNCKTAEKLYGSCHASVMGTGNYNNQKDCGDELHQWLECCRRP